MQHQADILRGPITSRARLPADRVPSIRHDPVSALRALREHVPALALVPVDSEGLVRVDLARHQRFRPPVSRRARSVLPVRHVAVAVSSIPKPKKAR